MRKGIHITRFSMIEIALSLVILALLAISFFHLLNKLDAVNAQYEREFTALVVLDNCLERLGAERSLDLKKVTSVFMDEFNASPLKKEKSVSYVVDYKNGLAKIEILDAHKLITGIKIKCGN